MTLPSTLTSPIETLDDGRAWIRALIAADLLFHFEDSPESILAGVDGKPLFAPHDVPLIKRQIAALYRLEWPDGCPIGYALECIEGA